MALNVNLTANHWELASSLAANPYEDIFLLVELIAVAMGDSEFTDRLYETVKRLKEEE